MVSINRIVERIGRQQYLAYSLLIYLLADALFPRSRVLSFGILALMIITGPLAVGRDRRHRNITIGLAVLMVALGLASASVESPVVFVATMVVSIMFFGALIYLITGALMFHGDGVTGETLWAAINVYLLFGLLFAFLYALTATLIPDAFSGEALLGDGRFSGQTFIYFSYVTMTTLGYGDITPNVQMAATLAYVQALIGQLYVAILIARLVSLYSVQANRG